MKYLFWNTNKNPKINTFLEPLIREQECDIVLLAEYVDNVNELLKSLSSNQFTLYHKPTIACSRITALSVFTPGKIKLLEDGTYFTLMQTPHRTLGFHLLVGLHFPSKLYDGDDIDYIAECLVLKSIIEEAERTVGNNKTVVVGDFNMNPFEKPMISALGFHSLPTKKETLRSHRIVKEKSYSMFYNPMWSLFGDKDIPAGTYYYPNSGQVTFFWNIFDQVIVRPSLLENLKNDSLKIINQIKNISLLDSHERPHKSISDHLPIVFEII